MKKCTNGKINGFFDMKVTHIKDGVKNEINEVITSYERLIFGEYVPFFMIDQLISELTDCALPSTDIDAYDCLNRVSTF